MSFNGLNLQNSVLETEVYTGGATVQYVALLSRYESFDSCLHVKVQDNDSNGTFDRAFFYGGMNGNSIGLASRALTPFSQAKIRTITVGNTVTLEIDTDFDGDPEQVLGPYDTPDFPGTRVGLGFYGPAQADNFAVDEVQLLTTTLLYTQGEAVPGAGSDPRIQAGAVWSGFGSPAIDGAGEVAFVGKWKAPKTAEAAAQSGTGIFAQGHLLAKVDESVPGAGSGGLPSDAAFKGFKDPVIDEDGHVAFLATIKGTGVTTANDTVVVSDGRTGTLEILAREGGVAPGTGGALFKGFSALSIRGGASGGGTLFTAALIQGGAVTSANDTGAWWQPTAEPAVLKLVREGDAFGAETIKSFILLKALGGSPGHGRGQSERDFALVQLSLTGGTIARQVQAYAEPNRLEELFGTGDVLGGSVLPEATWSKVGLASGDSVSNMSVLASLTPKVGGVASANAKGIFVTHNGASWSPLARLGEAASGLSSTAAFSGFKDPVNSSTGAEVAFLGTVKGDSVTTATNDGIWFSPDGVALELIAQEGTRPPGAPALARWKSFSSLALPGGGVGPLFTAFLHKGTTATPDPSGITTLDDFALYGMDSSGELHELLRENQPLFDQPGKTVKSFSVLKAVAGSAGATRSFNAEGQVAAQVTFTDKLSSIVLIDIP